MILIECWIIMSLYRITENTASVKDVIGHLEKCSKNFYPPLFTYVDISVYSIKIVNNAETVEIWHENILIGLVAIYLNDSKFEHAFITNISVDENFQGIGLSKKMLDLALQKAKNLGFKYVSLDVSLENEKAINLYKSRAFLLIEKKKTGFVKMIKTIL
jgi:GNAT superfamily N-acetyltransferase